MSSELNESSNLIKNLACRSAGDPMNVYDGFLHKSISSPANISIRCTSKGERHLIAVGVEVTSPRFKVEMIVVIVVLLLVIGALVTKSR